MPETISLPPNAKYRPQRCTYCAADTWCERRNIRSSQINTQFAWQCRACKVTMFFENFLYPPLVDAQGKSYRLQGWQREVLRDLYGTVNEHDGKRQYREAFISLGKQNGKALDINTLVPRPGGYSSMEQLRIGDMVLSEETRPIRISAKSQVDDQQRAFELYFSDGTVIVAGASHQWLAHANNGPGLVRETLEMFDMANAGANFRIKSANQKGSPIGQPHIIKSIVEVEPRPMQCIEVENESHLYLCGESLIPTHNSFLLGGLPIYHLLMEHEMQAEAFGVASARDQAGITFKAAKLLVDSNPRLQKLLKVSETVKRIIQRNGRGVYAVLAAEGKTQDGKRPSLLLIDELHRFTRQSAVEVHSVLTKGTISRAEPLTIQITTSGDELESPLWHREYEAAQRLINGSSENKTHYAKIWQADPKRIAEDPEYWKTREARVAANPSHEDNGGFLLDERIEEQMKQAIEKPELYTGYIRLNLNVPIAQTHTPAIDMQTWYAGGGEAVDLRKWPEYDVDLLIKKWGLIDRPCVLGVDLAWSIDFTAMACLFPPSGDLDPTNTDPWKVLMFYWMPEKRVVDIQRRIRQPLDSWIKRKFMTTVPGVEMKMKVIEEKIKWASEMFDVRELTFDKWGGMRALGEKMSDDEGMTAVDVRQGYATISAPTKEFIAMQMAGRLEHGNNPILNFNAGCLSLQSDGSNNVKPNKPESASDAKRIDGVAAIITALQRAMLLYEPESVYARRGPLIIE